MLLLLLMVERSRGRVANIFLEKKKGKNVGGKNWRLSWKWAE